MGTIAISSWTRSKTLMDERRVDQDRNNDDNYNNYAVDRFLVSKEIYIHENDPFFSDDATTPHNNRRSFVAQTATVLSTLITMGITTTSADAVVGVDSGILPTSTTTTTPPLPTLSFVSSPVNRRSGVKVSDAEKRGG